MIRERQGNKNNNVRKEIVLQRESILPYFHGGNLFSWQEFGTFQDRCVIAHKIPFSPSLHYENMAKGYPIFEVKIWQSFMFGVL